MVIDLPSTVALVVFTTGCGVGVGAGVEAVPELEEPPQATASSAAATADRMNRDPCVTTTLPPLSRVDGPPHRRPPHIEGHTGPRYTARSSAPNWSRGSRAYTPPPAPSP